MPTADSLIKYKGLADILVASILIFKPDIIYGSLPAQLLASWTGLVGFQITILFRLLFHTG